MCRVSVIVPTHNRAAFLPDHLARVLGQTFPGYEAIYVNDSSDDATAEILAEHAARFPDRLRAVTAQCGAPGPARNAGAKIARGELLLFVDDDVCVSDDWVAQMVASFARHGGAAVCGGIAPASTATSIERYLHARVAGVLGTHTRRIGAAPMMNFIVARDAFERTGGFLDTPLRAAEDQEFCRRLWKSGVAIVFDPSAAVTHRYQSELGPALHRMRDAGAAGVYIWLLHHKGAFFYTAYSLVRCAVSPFWVPFRYPMDLYALAVHMEYVFAEARLLAYLRHRAGKEIV